MRPGLFLGMSHNIGNVFSYELLAVYNYCDIPTYGRLHTVIHSVVRKCELTDKDTPTICEENGIWMATNRNGEAVGEECSTHSEELHSNIEVFEEEAHYFDGQMQRPRRKV